MFFFPKGNGMIDLSPVHCFMIMCVLDKLLYYSIKSFLLFFLVAVCICIFECWAEEGERVFERGGVGDWEREREISDSLIKDVSKTLIKIEYPCKCKATCNLQVFHLEQLSQCEAVFLCLSFFIAHK